MVYYLGYINWHSTIMILWSLMMLLSILSTFICVYCSQEPAELWSLQEDSSLFIWRKHSHSSIHLAIRSKMNKRNQIPNQFNYFYAIDFYEIHHRWSYARTCSCTCSFKALLGLTLDLSRNDRQGCLCEVKKNWSNPLRPLNTRTYPKSHNLTTFISDVWKCPNDKQNIISIPFSFQFFA